MSGAKVHKVPMIVSDPQLFPTIGTVQLGSRMLLVGVLEAKIMNDVLPALERDWENQKGQIYERNWFAHEGHTVPGQEGAR